eukprot:1635387-Amphidinium_carterae.1
MSRNPSQQGTALSLAVSGTMQWKRTAGCVSCPLLRLTLHSKCSDILKHDASHTMSLCSANKWKASQCPQRHP